MKKDVILHDSFEVGVVLKGIESALEILGGILLLFISPATINNGSQIK